VTAHNCLKWLHNNVLKSWLLRPVFVGFDPTMNCVAVEGGKYYLVFLWTNYTLNLTTHLLRLLKKTVMGFGQRVLIGTNGRLYGLAQLACRIAWRHQSILLLLL
jgi:hypothetical protein